MSYFIENLEYSIAKRVTSMESGFDIATNYGEIHIDGSEAGPIIKAVNKVLAKKLKAATKIKELLP